MDIETLNIRPATFDDSEFVAKSVMAALGQDEVYATPLPKRTKAMIKRITSICQREDVLYSWKNTLIAEIEGKPVASLTAYNGTNYKEMRERTFALFDGPLDFDIDLMQDETHEGEYYLDSATVLPEYRNQGIGRKLLLAGIETGKKLSIPHVTLLVSPNNHKAKKLYRSLGFREAGEIYAFGENYQRMKLDTADPMRIDILTVLPEMLEGFLNCSILARAQKKGLVEIHVHNLRDWTLDKHKRVDDYPYGGCAGMVMQCEPIDRCIESLQREREYDEVIFTTPDGEKFDQPMANMFSMKKNIIILCGHFKGVDYRIREHLITKEVSIGDYVLTGGELAAAVMTDAIVRIIPGVIGDEQSALSDSFQDNLLAPPVYTRPADYKGWKVPDVLLSGHEKNIRNWELEQAIERTKRLRPDLLSD
jgi:tRNA (guanine37-N1)-methyltransferase